MGCGVSRTGLGRMSWSLVLSSTRCRHVQGHALIRALIRCPESVRNVRWTAPNRGKSILGPANDPLFIGCQICLIRHPHHVSFLR